MLIELDADTKFLIVVREGNKIIIHKNTLEIDSKEFVEFIKIIYPAGKTLDEKITYTDSIIEKLVDYKDSLKKELKKK